jgi:hypothetical protein
VSATTALVGLQRKCLLSPKQGVIEFVLARSKRLGQVIHGGDMGRLHLERLQIMLNDSFGDCSVTRFDVGRHSSVPPRRLVFLPFLS